MSAPLRDDSYRLPHYGRDGVMPNWLKGWKPSELPNLPPIPVTPGIPIVPGFPWWVDPWTPPTPQPSVPWLRQPQTPSRPSAPNSLAVRTQIGDGGGLLGLLQEVISKKN